MRLDEQDILCVGFADWDAELWTNQQHLMSRLARRNRVLFVESLGLRQPQLAGRDVRRILARLRRGVSGPRSADGLKVLAPLVLPFHGRRGVAEVNDFLLPRLVSRALQSSGMRHPILWSYVPQAEVLIDALSPRLVVYHCVDDIAAQKGVDPVTFRAAERRFAGRADVVIASAPSLAERLGPMASRVVYMPNVADTDLFATALEDSLPPDAEVAALPGPRIVFTGAIVATKLDFALISDLARLRPSWSFVLIGPIGVGDPSTDVSGLRAIPNVHLMGGRRHDGLPSVLRAADAALIPYRRSPLTDSIFPMKVYEYLAAGLPVAATPLPALVGVEDVTVAADAQDMATKLDDLLAGDSAARRGERSRRAAGHSWASRLAEIDEVLASVR